MSAEEYAQRIGSWLRWRLVRGLTPTAGVQAH